MDENMSEKSEQDMNSSEGKADSFTKQDARLINMYEDLIRFLTGGIANCALYPGTHPMVKRSVEQLYQVIQSLLSKSPEITMGLVDRKCIVEGVRLDKIGDLLAALSSRLLKRKIEKIVFLKGLTEKELLVVIQLLAQEPEMVLKKGGAEEIIISKGVRNIKLRRLDIGEDYDEDMEAAKKLYEEGLDSVKETLYDARKKGEVDLGKARDFVGGLISNIMDNPSPFLSLASLKNHDEYTFTHCINVSALTVAQGKSMGFPEEVLNDFGIAGLMHDVGKEKVPVEIINKKGKLTDEEFNIMREHATYGAKMLMDAPDSCELAVLAAYEHQMKYDLSGYPKPVKKRPLNLCSMMVTIADVFDALKSQRSYSGEIASEKALMIMAESAETHFEPTLLKRFLQIVGIYPPGSFVRLNTGQLGIVSKPNNEDSFRPQVKIFLSEDGSKIDPAEIANLWVKDEKSGGYKLFIEKSENPAELGIEPRDYL